MPKARDGGGGVSAVVMRLSSAAHVLLGWKVLSAELEAAHVQGHLLLGLRIGWYFGGVAMLLLGIIPLTLFAAGLRGERRPLLPAAAVSIGYLAFGGWALAISGDPFFAVFIVPG